MRGRYTEFPYVRILGADCTGKTTVCDALTSLFTPFVQFSSTEPYVYDWLRTYGIGRSSSITPDQLGQREQIFLSANRVQMRAIKEVSGVRPVVAVRGRADTIITHGVLNGRKLERDIDRLMPLPYMRPDLLVVLTAPTWVIAERLKARGEAATGANSLDFHRECQRRYLEVCNLVEGRCDVVTFDTSNARHTPSFIASQILGRPSLRLA